MTKTITSTMSSFGNFRNSLSNVSRLSNFINCKGYKGFFKIECYSTTYHDLFLCLKKFNSSVLFLLKVLDLFLHSINAIKL